MRWWEYKIVYDYARPFEERLNKLGLEGWELVAVTVNNSVGDVTKTYFLKRERSGEEYDTD
jgi:hypothetical protein